MPGSVDCDQGPQLYSDLQMAAESLVVANHLHMLYLVTPYDMLSTHLQPNWMLYLDEVQHYAQFMGPCLALITLALHHV